MKKITSILLLAVFFMANNAFACINGATLALKNGMFVYEDLHKEVPYGHTFINGTKAMDKNIKELEGLYQKTKDLDYLSDKGIVLILSKKYQAAIDLYLAIEKQKPNLYNTAANLGTAYELAGQNENALLWIKKAVALNPESHNSSEWLHVKILEAKIKGATAYTTAFLLNTDFGTDAMPTTTLNMEALYKLGDALFYQLNERTSFIKTKEPIVAELLFALGNVYFLRKSHYDAEETYKLARKYGCNSDLIKKRIALNRTKIHEDEGGAAAKAAKQAEKIALPKPVITKVVAKNESYDNRYLLSGLVAFLLSIVGFFGYRKYKR